MSCFLIPYKTMSRYTPSILTHKNSEFQNIFSEYCKNSYLETKAISKINPSHCGSQSDEVIYV